MEYEDYEALVRGNVLAGKLTDYLNKEYDRWASHINGNMIEVFVADEELVDFEGDSEDNIFDATFYAYDYILCKAGYDLEGETLYGLMDSYIIEISLLSDMIEIGKSKPVSTKWAFSDNFF